MADDDKTPTPSDDFLARLEKLLAKGGDGSQVDAALQGVIREQRAEISRLQEANRSLRDKLPPEGATVLSGDEAEAWAAYRELGEPAELKERAGKVSDLEARLAERDRRDLAQKAAAAAGFRAAVLAKLPGTDDLTFEVRREGQGDEAADVAYVKPEEGDAVKLTDYADEHWSDFLPALREAEADEKKDEGQPFPKQPTRGKGGGGEDPVQEFIASRNERMGKRPNPLRPAATT